METPKAKSAATTTSAAHPVNTGSTNTGRPSLAVARLRRSGGVSARTASPANRPSAIAALAMATPPSAGRTSAASSALARWALSVVHRNPPSTASGTNAAADARLPIALTRSAAANRSGAGGTTGLITSPASPAASPTPTATGAISPTSAR